VGEFFKFLDNVLNKGGVVATLFFVLVFACGFAIRVLWNRNQALHKQVLDHSQALKNTVESHSRQLQKLQATHADQLQKLQATHADQLQTMARANTDEMKSLAEQHTGEKRVMGTRIDDLQERRVDETRSITEKVMAYIQHIDTFVAKLEVTIDVLMNAARR
jgi:Skp family chaperone for outer membrane proteins